MTHSSAYTYRPDDPTERSDVLDCVMEIGDRLPTRWRGGQREIVEEIRRASSITVRDYLKLVPEDWDARQRSVKIAATKGYIRLRPLNPFASGVAK